MKARVIILAALLILIGWLATLINQPIVPESESQKTRLSAPPAQAESQSTGDLIRSRARNALARRDELSLLLSSSLESESERQSFYNALTALPPSKIYEIWAGASDPEHERRRSLIEIALAGSLKRFGKKADAQIVYQSAAMILRNDDQGDADKIRVANWLSQSGTPESLRILLEAVDNPANGQLLRVELLRQLSEVGNSHWDADRAEELSAQLQTKWKEVISGPQPDMHLIHHLAQGLAKVGHPSGIDLLLKELASLRAHSPDPNRAKWLLNLAVAFRDVRSDASVSLLNSAILNESSDSPLLVAAGEGLVAMGTDEAAQGLVRWAQRADKNSVKMATYLFSRLWHPSAIQRARQELAENPGFESEEVRQAIQSALEAIP